jgi:ABC-2 type transport system permease protein
MKTLSAAEDASTFRPRRSLGSVVAAIVRRDLVVTTSYRVPFVLDLLFGVLNLAIYFFISRTFQDFPSAQLHGAPSYFAFAAVGIAITMVIDAASTGLARRIREEQLTGTLEALLTQPITVSELSFGLAGFPFLFAMLRALFYLLVASVVLGVDFSQADWLGFVLVLVASGLAFAGLGVLSGAVMMVIKRGDVLVGIAVFGMGLASGAFFPVEVLPNWIQPIGEVVPTRFAFDGLRSAIFRGEGWRQDALILVLFGLVSLPLAVWTFEKALAYARRTGSVSQY